MLIDEAFPYTAHAPWPKITRDGSLDWVSSMETVEDWLCTHVGPHAEAWAWRIDYKHTCSVCFAQESVISLFLLQFGDYNS